MDYTKKREVVTVVPYLQTSLRLHMRFTDHHGSSGRHGERTINNQYNGYYNNDITNQDPVIEEVHYL